MDSDFLTKPATFILACLWLAAFHPNTARAAKLACVSSTSSGGVTSQAYFPGSTCADVKTAAEKTGTTVNSCTDYNSAVAVSPSQFAVRPLFQEASSSSNLVLVSLALASNSEQPSLALFLDVSGSGTTTYLARWNTNDVAMDIATLPSPTIDPNAGAFFAQNAFKAGQVVHLPFQEPASNALPSTADFTITYASFDSNLTVLASESVTVDVSTLTFTPLLDSYSVEMVTGYKWIANQLDRGRNTLNVVLPSVPDQSQLLKWDKSSQSLLAPETFVEGFGWVDAAFEPSATTLDPGEGAYFYSPSPFTLTFTGNPNVPQFPLALLRETFYFLSRQDVGPGTYEDVTGLPPENGALVLRWNAAAQIYSTNIYDGAEWTPAVPTLEVGEAAFYRLPLGASPTITQHPQSLTVTQGTRATFSVVAQGSPALTYSWDLDGDLILGADGTNYTTPPVTLADDGAHFFVTVSNGFGAVRSEAAILTVIPDSSCIIFAGLEHCPFGAATLSVISNRMVVRNLGTQGHDGVRISLGLVEGFTTVVPLRPDAPLGALMVSSFSGPQAPGETNVAAGTIGMRQTAEGFVALVDFSSLGSPTYTARIYGESNLVLAATGLSGEMVNYSPFEPIELRCRIQLSPLLVEWLIVNTYTGAESAAAFTIAGVGTNVLGHSIVFTPDISPPGPVVVTDVQIVAANMPQLEVLSESIQFFGLNHTAAGQAAFQIQDGSLIVTNLGTNGADGVIIDLGQVAGWEAVLAPLDTGILATGAYLEARTDGVVSGAPPAWLLSTRIEDVGAELEATFDFTRLGINSYTVQVRSNGMVVDIQTGLTGPAARFANVGCIIDPIDTDPPCTPVLTIRSPSPTAMTITGHAPILGDELRAFPDEGTAVVDIDYFTRFHLLASAIPSFTINQETVVPLVPLDPSLTISFSSASPQLAWSGGSNCRVQSTSALRGPNTVWVDVPGATSSPYVIPNQGPDTFYRLFCP